MIINELDSLEFFIKEDNYKTYQAQNRLKTLFYYITHYNNDLQPEIYKFNDNYIFYRLSKKDYLRDFLINDIIGCSDLDLIYIAKDLTQNYNKQKGYKMNYNKILPTIILVLIWLLFINQGLRGFNIIPLIPLLIIGYLFYKTA